jgi:hypothetical protein
MKTARQLDRWLERLAWRAAVGRNAERYIRFSAEKLRPETLQMLAKQRMWSLIANLEVSLDWSKSRIERGLIHRARMKFADDARDLIRECARVAPRITERPTNAWEDPRFVKRLIAQVAVRQILTALPEDAFMTLDSYFPLANQRKAAEILSLLLDRKVSPAEYARMFEQVRREFAGMWLGLAGPYTGPLGPWPDGRSRQWREHASEVGELFNEVRIERKRDSQS